MKFLIFVALMVRMVESRAADNFQKGYYYDQVGQKIEGWLRYDQGTFGLFFNRPGHLRFRENPDSKKIKFGVNDVTSFVIGIDSFAIVYNIKVNAISGHFKKDFAQVQVVGPVTMFIHRCLLWSGKHYFPHQSVIISKDNKYFFAIWNPKKQKEKIAAFFSDDEPLQVLILGQNYYDRIPDLVGLYNKDKG